VLGRHRDADATFERMLIVARAEDDLAAAARARCWQSYIARRDYRLAEARQLAKQALGLAQTTAAPSLLALAHWNLGHLEKIEGDPTPAVAHLQLAEQAARVADAADIVGWSLQSLAQLAVWRGDYAQAVAQATEALALARVQRDPINAAGSAWVLGSAQGEHGRYGQALTSLQTGLALAHESGERHYLARLLNTLGWLHAEIGDFEAAYRWDEQSLEAAGDDAGDKVTEAERYALLNLATDALGLGDVDHATTYLDTFTQLLDDGEYARLRYLNRSQLLRAELMLVVGDAPASLALAEEAARQASVKGVRKNMAKGWLLAGRALMALARPREALERLRRATRLADELEHGSLRWQSRLWSSWAHQQAGQRQDAAALCGEAAQVLSARAAELPAGPLRATLLATPLLAALQTELASDPVVPPRYPAGLSEREVDVLRLVAQGMTNQAIADTLSISIKTVNTHMTSIFNKTDSANRAAATSFALRHGLA
jgi:ATP/maltotriose-dependent transcriptional regulator MalT